MEQDRHDDASTNAADDIEDRIVGNAQFYERNACRPCNYHMRQKNRECEPTYVSQRGAKRPSNPPAAHNYCCDSETSGGKREKFAFLYTHAPSQQYLLRAAALRGFAPRLIVDVGAFRGLLEHDCEIGLAEHCRIIMVEPDLEQTDHLRSLCAGLNASLYTDLLGSEDGTHVEFMESGSGFAGAQRCSAEDRNSSPINSEYHSGQPRRR
jgi:hypothetical protein